MQIDELILYNADGDTRPIPLRAGQLNVITGDSRTGKSSLINILRFLLGSGNPHTPYGPIQQSVAWYAMRAHVGETAFFIARPAPTGDKETSEAMLTVGATEAPALQSPDFSGPHFPDPIPDRPGGADPGMSPNRIRARRR